MLGVVRHPVQLLFEFFLVAVERRLFGSQPRLLALERGPLRLELPQSPWRRAQRNPPENLFRTAITESSEALVLNDFPAPERM